MFLFKQKNFVGLGGNSILFCFQQHNENFTFVCWKTLLPLNNKKNAAIGWMSVHLIMIKLRIGLIFQLRIIEGEGVGRGWMVRKHFAVSYENYIVIDILWY